MDLYFKKKFGVNRMDKSRWIICPVCGNKTRNRIREDTILKKFPLYCPKCKQESLINLKNLHVTVLNKPNTQEINLVAEGMIKKSIDSDAAL